MALWRGSACAGFLALAVGCIFLLEPELPGSALRSLWSSLRLGPAPPGPLSPESRLAAAWDTLIVQPARRWRRVAVGQPPIWIKVIIAWLNMKTCSDFLGQLNKKTVAKSSRLVEFLK
ncbi:ADP-dependent glucokinase-like isoform X2 [Cavia porcellus]|uniref:ADP-dependent glucokinase-like isoform X2 n=1 Tax=Cavia porcellus TaxID=10141 RepID=UPI002FDFEE14